MSTLADQLNQAKRDARGYGGPLLLDLIYDSLESDPDDLAALKSAVETFDVESRHYRVPPAKIAEILQENGKHQITASTISYYRKRKRFKELAYEAAGLDPNNLPPRTTQPLSPPPDGETWEQAGPLSSPCTTTVLENAVAQLSEEAKELQADDA